MHIATTLAFMLFGYLSASAEAQQIAHNNRAGITRPLDHAMLMKLRGVVMAAWIIGVAIITAIAAEFSLLRLLLLVFVGMASFAIVHRATINKQQGRSLFYLGSDAVYDRHWMRRMGVKHIPTTSAEHSRKYTNDKGYRRRIHLGAMAAYIAEIIIGYAALYYAAP